MAFADESKYKAYDELIESLKCDQRNIWALVLMGNLLTKEKNDIEHAKQYYDKVLVSGLVILIVGQAFMHMAVNVHLPLVPQTGQTLPLVSHGTNSFLVFSVVFGILLSISKDARENMAKREAQAEPIIEHSDDEVKDTLDDLETFETEE